MIQLDRHDASKLDSARAIVRNLSSVLVAYSGGVDSSLLLKLALDELGERSRCWRARPRTPSRSRRRRASWLEI
jgi:PP-loop superfamily ATP-utilizing enzyme